MGENAREKHDVSNNCDSCGQSLVSFSPKVLKDRDTCPFCRDEMGGYDD